MSPPHYSTTDTLFTATPTLRNQLVHLQATLAHQMNASSLSLKPLGAALRTHGTQKALVSTIQQTTHQRLLGRHLDNPIQNFDCWALVLRQLAHLRCAQLRDSSTAPTWVAETPASHRRPPNHTPRGSLHHRRRPNRAAANPRGKLDKCRPNGRVAGCLTRVAQPHFSSRWSAAVGACAAPVHLRYLRQRRWPVST